MIRIEHVTLPAGLDAVAHRTAPGELYIVVSDLLEPGQQRAAVRAAVRAARRHAWEFGFLPLPLPLPLAAGLLPAAVRHLSGALRAHGVLAGITGTVAAAAAAVTAVVVVTGTPAVRPQHGAIAPPGIWHTRRPSGPGSPAPAGSRPGRSAPGRLPGHEAASDHDRETAVGPAADSAAQPDDEQHLAAARATAAADDQPGDKPAATATPTPTSTSSSPPPSSGGGQTCLVLLGVVVCL